MAGMERFTQRARRVLSLAHQEAERSHQESIGTEHLLIGLIEEDGGVAGRVLRELGLESARVREMVGRVSMEGHAVSGKLELADDTQQVLGYAVDEAAHLGHHYIGTEHILLGLGARRRIGDGSASQTRRDGGSNPTADSPRAQRDRIIPGPGRFPATRARFNFRAEDSAHGSTCG